MGSIEQQVAKHYTHGTLESAILAGLDQLKVCPRPLQSTNSPALTSFTWAGAPRPG